MNYPIIQTATGTADRSRFFITLGAKNKKTGASELAVFSHVFGLDLEKIREDVSVTIGGHRYEPDLAYIDKENGVYVDIEIDEPYSSFHRPTHFITEDGTHKDQRRNKLFLSAGWHVCRFTEQQMFCQTKSCMKAVYELLLQVGAIEAIPAKLANAPTLKFEPCWTAEKSKKRSYAHYRKSYLGYDPMTMDFSSCARCSLLLIPIMFQATYSKRMRRMLFRQLRNTFKSYHLY